MDDIDKKWLDFYRQALEAEVKAEKEVFELKMRVRLLEHRLGYAANQLANNPYNSCLVNLMRDGLPQEAIDDDRAF